MENLGLLDWILVVIVLASALLSLWRGFAREAISLAAWVVAFFVATMFSPSMEVLLEGIIDNQQVRHLCAFALLFVATLVVGSMLGLLLRQLLKVTGLGLLDRILGMAFGLVRGVVLALALVLLAELAMEASDVARPAWYRQSVLVPQLLLLENWARDTTAQLLNWLSSWEGGRSLSAVGRQLYADR